MPAVNIRLGGGEWAAVTFLSKHAFASFLALMGAGGALLFGYVIFRTTPADPLAQAELYLGFLLVTSVAVTFAVAGAARSLIRFEGRPSSVASFVLHGISLGIVATFALWLQSIRMLGGTNFTLLAGLALFMQLV